MKDDPFAFTEASSSMWSSNDPVRAVEVAKRQRLSALTEKVEEKRREDRATIEDVDQSQLPTTSSAVTASRGPSSDSSRLLSAFRFTTSLQRISDPLLPDLETEQDEMDVAARNASKQKAGEGEGEETKPSSDEEKAPMAKRRRIVIPAAPTTTEPTFGEATASPPASPAKPKVHNKRRTKAPSSPSSASVARPISSPPRIDSAQRQRALPSSAATTTTPVMVRQDSPPPSESSPQPTTPPVKPPIKFATPQRNLALKQRVSDSSPTAATHTITTTTSTTQPLTPERPSASRFLMNDRFATSSPRSTTSGSLAPPNLGELTRKLRNHSSPSSSSSSQLLSSSPFKQLRLASTSSASSTSLLPTSQPALSFVSTSSSSSSSSSSALSSPTSHQSPRSPDKQLTSAVEKEMRRFRRTQETRVRSFQAEVREGLSPFRGRKLFPEPEIDDDAILPPIIKPEPRHDEDEDLPYPHPRQRDVCSAALMDVTEASTLAPPPPPPEVLGGSRLIGANSDSHQAIILD